MQPNRNTVIIELPNYPNRSASLEWSGDNIFMLIGSVADDYVAIRSKPIFNENFEAGVALVVAELERQIIAAANLMKPKAQPAAILEPQPPASPQPPAPPASKLAPVIKPTPAPIIKPKLSAGFTAAIKPQTQPQPPTLVAKDLEHIHNKLSQKSYPTIRHNIKTLINAINSEDKERILSAYKTLCGSLSKSKFMNDDSHKILPKLITQALNKVEQILKPEKSEPEPAGRAR